MNIRDALEAAVTEHETTAPETATVETTAAPSSPSSNVPAEPTTVVDGTDVSPDADKGKGEARTAMEAAGDKPAAEPKPDDKPTDATNEVKKDHRVDRPPASWKKEAKGEWAAIPLHIRQEVHKREMEISRVLQETTQARQQVQEIQQVVSPFMARIQAAGISPTQAIGELLKADYTLATAPKAQRAQYMARLISEYDIDISELDSAIVAARQGGQQHQQSAQPQGIDPNQINALVQQQLNQALAPFYQQRQQQDRQVQQEAVATVEQLSLDPKYPYFDEVRQEMADLIEVASRRGVELSIKDAYDRAVAVNPMVREQVARQSVTQQANQSHLQAQRAKAASSSVTGSPAAGGSNTYVGDGSLRGTIEAAFGGIR